MNNPSFQTDPTPQEPGEPMRPLLKVEDVAARLGVTPQWVYRRAPRWPFTRKFSGKMLRFDPDGFDRWEARHKP